MVLFFQSLDHHFSSKSSFHIFAMSLRKLLQKVGQFYGMSASIVSMMMMLNVAEGAFLMVKQVCSSLQIHLNYQTHSIDRMLFITIQITAQVYLLRKILNQTQNNYHLMQDCKQQLLADWSVQQKEHTTLLSQTTFMTLNSDFKFIIISTINKSIKLFTIQGRLVFNNGSTVFISTGHQSFVHHYLNEKFDPIKKKVIFTIDQASQTLTFAGKMSNITDSDNANRFIKTCQEEILGRKKCILCVLAIIGVPLDYENALMRKILIQKKKLKNNLQGILKKMNEKEQYEYKQMLDQQQKSDDEEGGVIYFGENTDFELEYTMEQETEKQKTLQGGYFSIEPSSKRVKNKSTGEFISKKLVRKTLKQKRKKQDENQRAKNEIKMRKQIQIIKNIKNKKYLIKYYCDYNQMAKDKLSQVYMDQYEHSLQQYVHYLGDSLQYLHKINISKQVVDAILTLHQSGVIHRDIKPANFLIDDSNNNPNHYKVKIIDFAQSYAKHQAYSNIDYACSHPYSPLQCIDKKGFNENGPMEGIGKKEIDYWSVGITIYEIFFRKLPVSFSRAFLVDITSSWKTELLVAVNQREKFGFNLVQDIISIICVKMMKFSQDQRMKLTLTKRILEALETYIQNLIQIAEDNA